MFFVPLQGRAVKYERQSIYYVPAKKSNFRLSHRKSALENVLKKMHFNVYRSRNCCAAVKAFQKASFERLVAKSEFVYASSWYQCQICA